MTALGLASVLSLSACGLLDDSTPSASPTVSVAPGDQTEITMAVWGGFGLDDLIAEYEAAHPDVVVTLISGDYNPLHDSLQRELVAGSGAPTIAAIGEDYIAKFASQPDQFVNLSTLGAADYKDAYLPWKWAEGMSPDGSAVIGMGADVSGLALCYRSDLFAAAGLPTDRLAVSGAMKDSWEGFLTLGAQYSAASDGAAFIDNAASLLTPIRNQTGASYYDASGALTTDTAKTAFDVANKAIDTGLSAGYTPFSDTWDKGLSDGSFAATLCPVWGMGYIQGVVTEENYEPKWDIADIPGPGGSWGGSFYTIPAQASPEERDAAWEFLRWLLAPAQQLKVFQATGSLPSQPSVYNDSSVKDYKIPFFNDAPVGVILSKAVEELPVATSQDPRNGAVQAAMEQVLNGVQTGDVATADAWKVAVEAAKVVDAANSTSPTASAAP
ncbi:MAG: extracellular solute-binding protein [Demequinaceae bacterium]|nr:extracellular solute-binding protein [Demequinaceae bacterium]